MKFRMTASGVQLFIALSRYSLRSFLENLTQDLCFNYKLYTHTPSQQFESTNPARCCSIIYSESEKIMLEKTGRNIILPLLSFIIYTDTKVF